MNWDAIGAAGEATSALAVLITLVYLAIQVRAYKQQAIISSIQHINDSLNSFGVNIAASESLASVVRRGRESYLTLALDEQIRFEQIYGVISNNLESWHFQINRTMAGGLRDEQLRNVRENILMYFAFPGAVEFWRRYAVMFNPDFRKLFEQTVNVT